MNLRLATVLWIVVLTSVLGLAGQSNSASPPSIIHVRASAGPIKTFDPDVALGTSIDVLPQGVVDKIYTPNILKESLSAGWGPITYRLNTELQGTAWHWNPVGTWSDLNIKVVTSPEVLSRRSSSVTRMDTHFRIVATQLGTGVHAANIRGSLTAIRKLTGKVILT